MLDAPDVCLLLLEICLLAEGQPCIHVCCKIF